MEENQETNKDKRPRLANSVDQSIMDVNHLSSKEKAIKIVVGISNASQQIEQIEKKKLKKAVKLTNLIKEMNLQQIQSTFCIPILVELKSQLNECRTDVEKQLLNTIENIAKCCAEEQCEEQQEEFAKDFSDSGICEKIQDCIEVRKPNKEYDFDDDEWMMNETLLQLARIFCLMPNFEDDENIAFCVEMILISHFDAIFYDIKELIKKMTDSKDNNTQEEKQQNLKQQIEKMNKLLIATKYGIKSGNLNYLNIDNTSLRDRIQQLFHINCPSNLKCSHNITFPESIDAKPLHLLALDALCCFNYEFDEEEILLIDAEIAVAHLSPIIIQFANHFSFYNKKIMRIKKQQIHSPYILNPSQQQLVIYFTLIHKLLLYNNGQQIEVASQSDFISIIFAFSSFNKKKNEEQFEISKQSIVIIRECCLDIISDIIKFLDKNDKRKFLIRMKFIKQIIITSGIKGGCLESKNSIISSVQYCFNSITSEKEDNIDFLLEYSEDDYVDFLRKDDDFDDYQIHLDINEEIEEYGGFEEFDNIISNN